VFDHPFYLLLNLAVGGALGGRVPEDTVFPQRFVIDYVRAYAPRS
jgi:beta-glucanase (GH16 family)